MLYDKHRAQNSLDTIVPDLAESWSWNEEPRSWLHHLQVRFQHSTNLLVNREAPPFNNPDLRHSSETVPMFAEIRDGIEGAGRDVVLEA